MSGMMFVSLIGLGVLVEVLLGLFKKRGYFWILVDERGKYSLSRFQLSLWTVVIVAAFATMSYNVVSFDVEIPTNVLSLFGVTSGAAVLSQAIKSSKMSRKDKDGKPVIEALSPDKRAEAAPRFTDVISVEETGFEDMLDVGKFQMFWFTAAVLILYVSFVIGGLGRGEYSTLPDIPTTLLEIMGLSNGAYILNKIPD